MVIDKTTGKGCAWSIASEIITQKLLAEGIAGKIICRRPGKKGYELLQVLCCGTAWVYVTSQEDSEPAEHLWAPSFVDMEIWKQAVQQFQACERVNTNVEKYLLPNMAEYLQSISETELAAMTKNFLLDHGVIHTPISQRAGKTYYFNENEIYSLDKNSELFPYERRIKFNTFRIYETCFNTNVWRKAVSQFQVGTTLEECVKIFLKTELVPRTPKELSPVDRLVQHISSASYERVPGNQNEATFDRIRIIVGLPRYQFDSWEALRKEVKKYRREICRLVIEKLKTERQFKKYGVPVNFLRLSNITLLRDFSMEFIFELKEFEIPAEPAGGRNKP